MREYYNGLYGVAAYYLAKSTADVPFHIAYPILYTTIIYWMAGLKTEFQAYLTFLAVVIIIANIAQSLGIPQHIFKKILIADASLSACPGFLVSIPFELK